MTDKALCYIIKIDIHFLVYIKLLLIGEIMFTDLGVDLGTRKTVIVRGKKIVLNQPSVVLMEE